MMHPILVSLGTAVVITALYYAYLSNKYESSGDFKNKPKPISFSTLGTMFVIMFFFVYIIYVMIVPSFSQEDLMKYMDKGEPNF